MIEKIEKLLEKRQYWIEDGGDGIFICLRYVPVAEEQKELWKTAQIFFDDVQWCPEPEGHMNAGAEAAAVLNCFYPVEREVDDAEDVFFAYCKNAKDTSLPIPIEYFEEEGIVWGDFEEAPQTRKIGEVEK